MIQRPLFFRTLNMFANRLQNNKITNIDPVAAAILQYYPLPNQPGAAYTGTNNFFASGTAQLDIDTFDVRVDEVFSERNRLFVSYSRRDVTSPPALLFPKANQIAEGGNSEPQVSNSAAIDYTATVSPKFLIDVPFGFARTFINFVPISEGFNPSTELAFQGTSPRTQIICCSLELLRQTITPSAMPHKARGDAVASTSIFSAITTRKLCRITSLSSAERSVSCRRMMWNRARPQATIALPTRSHRVQTRTLPHRPRQLYCVAIAGRRLWLL